MFSNLCLSGCPACSACLQEKLVVKMGSAQLVSPAWNQSRPWLTGSWLMQFPAEFIAEVGGTAANSAGAVQLPPACDLSSAAPSQQEAALVADLLGVFMGQVGEYVVHAMVEGPKWQRLGLQVKGVTEPSLVEQVRGMQVQKQWLSCMHQFQA
jgi:hypothetical protein